MQPNPIDETTNPLLPNVRVFMSFSYFKTILLYYLSTMDLLRIFLNGVDNVI